MLDAPRRLTCDFLTNPRGIDALSPRLSWWVADTRPAEKQAAFRVLAATSQLLLDREQTDLWDSSRVDSGRNLCRYEGKALSSGDIVWWKVQTWDSDGELSPWSSAACFEIGLLLPEDWTGLWIRAGIMGSRERSVQAPAFRREFLLRNAPVSGRLYLAARGLARAFVNGGQVSEDELSPGWSDYRSRLRYVSYDVSGLLQDGNNVLGVLLADGWYSGRIASAPRQRYGDAPSLLCQLLVTYADGTRTSIGSDQHWQWRASHILSTDLCDGEHVDSRQYQTGWHRPDPNGGTSGSWQTIELDLPPPIAPTSVINQPLRPLRVIRPVAGPVEDSADSKGDRRSGLGAPADVTHNSADSTVPDSQESLPGLQGIKEPQMAMDTPSVNSHPGDRQADESGVAVQPPRHGIRRLFDFGQLVLGRARVSVGAPAGESVTVRYACNRAALSGTHDPQSRVRDPNENDDVKVSSDTFTCAGGDEELEAGFSLHAFRYVEVIFSDHAGQHARPEHKPRRTSSQILHSVRAVAIGSALADGVSFVCDHPGLTRLHDNVRRTLRGTLFDGCAAGIDVSRRLVDARAWQAALPVVARAVDSAALLRKVLLDQLDSLAVLRVSGRRSHLAVVPETTNGATHRVPERPPPAPAITSNAPIGLAPTALWPAGIDTGNALIHTAWTLYRHYGDEQAIEDVWLTATAFIRALEKQSPSLMVSGSGGHDDTPVELTGTAEYFLATGIMSRMALITGRLEDYEGFAGLAERIRQAFQEHFVTPSGRLAGDTQAAHVLGLAFNLVQDDARPAVLARLVELIEAANVTLTLPDDLAGYALPVLCEEGRLDLALRVLLNSQDGTWLHAIDGGASTCPSVVPPGNPCALAAIHPADWLYRYLVGLTLDPEIGEEANAWRRVRIRPMPLLGTIGSAQQVPVNSVEAYFDTVQGQYKVSWRLLKGVFVLQVVVPPGCEASVLLPDDSAHLIGAGSHAFRLELEQTSDGIPILRDVSLRH